MVSRGRHLSARALVAVSAAVLASGCASMGPVQPHFRGASRKADQLISVEVNNVGWADVVVYSVSGGSRIRLGLANSNQRTRFKLPRAHELAPDLHLQADPVGSRHTYDSEPIAPGQGQVVYWTIHESRGLRSTFVY